MHIIMPAAGRMRPKTILSGIFKTKRSRDVSVSRLTRMFVPKPKKAFQSPGTQSRFLAFMFFLDFFQNVCGASVADGAKKSTRKFEDLPTRAGLRSVSQLKDGIQRALDFKIGISTNANQRSRSTCRTAALSRRLRESPHR